jgi:iron(III) transport system substrate-binding protein
MARLVAAAIGATSRTIQALGVSAAAASVLLLLASSAGAQGTLPPELANDPVAKALGPEIINAARKEGQMNIYSGTTSRDFLDNGGQERFEKRFGIKIKPMTSELRKLVDRMRTEASVGRVVCDVFDGNDQYMLELYRFNALVKWRPPAPELDRISREAFVVEPQGYWWPVHISAQALVVNPNLIDPKSITSYWDVVDPKYKGKVAIRDPRSSGGGAWHMLGIKNTPGLGDDYLAKLKNTVEPFILSGGSNVIRDAVIRGQFAIGFSGRGDFFEKLPKGAPLVYVVPKEGLAWTPSSIALVNGAPNPNAAKVYITWLYEVAQLQLWTNHGRPVPHPDVKSPIPEMGVAGYPLMPRIPDKQLDEPNFFFKEMEKLYGIR